MLPNAERMAVNAAIEKLISRTDEDGEAARVVIRYGTNLQNTGSWRASFKSNSTFSGNSVSGHTPEHGDVTIKDKERDTQKERTFGINKERIGHYRIWKERDGLLKFHHFWKSDITTRTEDDDEPEIYHLGYDPDTHEPKYLGIFRMRVVLRFNFLLTIELSRPYLERINGTTPYLRGAYIILS